LRTFEKDRGATLPAKRPLFCYITDRRLLPDGSVGALLEHIESAIAAGVDLIQLREKDLTDRELFDLASGAARRARGTSCRILVNGRLDIARAAGAHGVHLPSRGLSAADLASCLPRGFLLGVSTHTLGEARRAAAAGAHYLLLGPVFPTPSKTGSRPLGLRRLQRACAAIPVPILGLGGIGPAEISSVLAAGACGVAGIRLFQQDPTHLLLPP